MVQSSFDTQIQIMAELGNPTRFAIFRLLLRNGRIGMTVGQIGQRLNVPASTLGFHLQGLVRVGLVQQNRHGRTIQCQANLSLLRKTFAEIEAECCLEEQQGESGLWNHKTRQDPITRKGQDS